MIYYFDLRKPAIFKDMFRKSGVIQQSQFRSWAAMFAIRHHFFSRAPSVCYYNRPKLATNDDKIIVFDSYTDARLLRWLRRRYPDKRIIFWYWNTVSNPQWMKNIPQGVEVWSFSCNDCRKYSLHYNTQFFFDCLAETAAECRNRMPSGTPRVLFLGRDKGRMKILNEIADDLRSAGAAVELHISPEPKGRFRAMREKLIPYEETIDFLKDADVLLDYTVNPDTGLSLRCMESMFFGKKLITNNREILDADFYDPANIYVLEHDARSYREFLETPVRPVAPQIRDRYLLSNWLKRFDIKGVTE